MNGPTARKDGQVPSHSGEEASPTSLSDSSAYLRLADWIEFLDKVRETCRTIREKVRKHTEIEGCEIGNG
jgi:hypothetical protein